MNTIILIGKVVEIKELKEDNSLKKIIQLSVKRNVCNYDGVYEYDLFDVELWRGIAEEINDNLKDINYVVIKGRIELKNNTYKIIAENVCVIN